MIQNLKTKAGTIFAFFLFISFALIFFSVATVSAQEKPTKPKPKKPAMNESETPAEKSLAVDAKVNISLCVSEGKINVHGWDRNEIRAYVSSSGSQVGFKTLQKNKSDQPVWVMVLGFDPMQTGEGKADECLSGDQIELDVPRGATVNIKGQESATTIESVGKVRIDINGGGIFLSDIAGGIEARTNRGGVTVGNSSGSIALANTEGNIIAFDVSPSEIGDVFKAKTVSGAIVLQGIEHRQVDAGSISGSIKFMGDFLSGGQYNFDTTSGAILLSIPEKSSCKLTAFYGFGQFKSDIPLENVKKSPTSGAQNITGQIGAGEATLNLKTFSGSIFLKAKK